MIGSWGADWKNMKWMYWLLCGCCVISLLLTVIFFFINLGYLREAHPYDAIFIAVVPKTDFPSEKERVILAKFNVNGVEMEKRSKDPCQYDCREIKAATGKKIAILYRDGDDYFAENTFFFAMVRYGYFVRFLH